MTDTTPRPELDREIATSTNGRDITVGYLGTMRVSADKLLRRRSGGDLALYEDVLSEPQVMSTYQQRRNAVTSREWRVEAASDRRVDKKAAEWLEQNLRHIGWDNVTDKMLYGVFFGYAAAELIWEARDGLLGWRAIKARDRRRFRFTVEGELRLLTLQNPLEGEPCERPYFWHYATGASHDDEPYGLGLGHWLYWPVLFKKNGIKFWLTFLEKFGSPTAIGRYDAGATPTEISRLLAALAAIQTDGAIAVPKGIEVDLLEAARAGTGDYKTLHDTMDATIAKIVLGQTMTSDNGSSRSQAEVHHDVRQDIIKADADLICESFNLGPVRWLTQLNFAGATPPRVFRVLEEEEDADQAADRDTKVSKLGFKPSLDYVKQRYGDHWEPSTPTAPPALPLLPGQPAPAAEFAEGAPADYTDNLVAAIAERAGPLTDGWVDRIRTEVNEASSFEDLLVRLADLQTGLPIDELGDLMGQGFGIAHRAGMSDATDDANA